MTTPKNENPIGNLLGQWQDARAELHELERAEHPDVTDRFGRVWTWMKGDLYRHCGNAVPKDMIDDFGLPTQVALDNQNYELCEICLDGRERNVTACKREWKCSHAACARIHLAEDRDEAYAENEARYAEARAEADAEQVADFTLEVVEPTESLEVRTEDGRRFPTELRLDLTGPLLEVFVPRDEALTDAERRVRNGVRANPAAWLGLLEWVALEDVAVGERVGFTQVEQPDPYGSRIAVERQGTVKRRGKTFVLVECDEDGYAGEVRLKANMWNRARVRRK